MDIKGDNIFVADDGKWVLGDFGSTVQVGEYSMYLLFLSCFFFFCFHQVIGSRVILDSKKKRKRFMTI